MPCQNACHSSHPSNPQGEIERTDEMLPGFEDLADKGKKRRRLEGEEGGGGGGEAGEPAAKVRGRSGWADVGRELLHL